MYDQFFGRSKLPLRYDPAVLGSGDEMRRGEDTLDFILGDGM